MKTFEVDFTQRLEITVDEEKFTDEFLDEFAEHFFPFDTVREHIAHIAQLYARGVYEGSRGEFVEGYGNIAEEFDVKIKHVYCDETIWD